MKIGLVGLPKSGKTSLVNLLTGASVATSSFGGSRAEMHSGVARVPDERVDRLSALFKPKKTTFATFEVVDLAGISKGEREGLDAKEFRNADALLHVVRAFADATGAAPNPKGDIADLETELILADLEVVERRLERLEASIKKKRTDTDVREQAILQRLRPALESETPIRGASFPKRTRGPSAASPSSRRSPSCTASISPRRSSTAAARSWRASGSRRSRGARARVWAGSPRSSRPRCRSSPERSRWTFSPTSGSPSPRSGACSATATRCSGCSRSSRGGRTRCGHGQCHASPAPKMQRR